MRALLIVDRLFAQHERAMLQRTAIGLLDEGIETKLVVPDLGVFDTTSMGSLIPQIRYKDRGLSFTLKIRAANIVRELADDRNDPQWDIIHAFGGNCWSLASELAKSLDSALVLELWRAGLISRASQLYKQSTLNCMFTAPDKSIERVVHANNPRLPIQVAPWGVPAPSMPREILNPKRGISIVMQSSGRVHDECAAAFDGVLDAIRNNENVHFFVNLHAAQRSGLWARAKKAGALGQLTLVDQIEEQRDLVLNADFLIYPDTVHEHRSLLFEAMGSAMCVIASTSEQSSCLIDGKTALVVKQSTRAGWSDSVRSLLADHVQARQLGQQAWKHIREQRKVSTHIGAMIDIYSQLVPLETGTRAVR
jgi:glycosyltransferase involved in cell wall biosynthesis